MLRQEFFLKKLKGREETTSFYKEITKKLLLAGILKSKWQTSSQAYAYKWLPHSRFL
jgi:hypothetical protein